MLAANLASMYM